MLIGYARVSTLDQNLDLQNDALVRAGCEKIFTDKEGGAVSTRPGLMQVMEMLREGDTLICWRLDRLGRSLKHLIELVGSLEERNIAFRSLQENIDTSTPGGRLIFHIFGALAEFEKNLILERTKAGLAAARARGRTGGRPKSLDAKQRRIAVRLYEEKEHSIQEICKMLRITKPTLYSYLKEARSQ